MYHLRNDTLAGIKLSSLFAKRDLGSLPVPKAVEPLNAYMSNAGTAKPESEAFKFYFANHVMSVISSKYDDNEPLPPEVADLARRYVKMSSDLVVRLAYYCLLITVREARHAYASSTTAFKQIEEECGKPVLDFLKKNMGAGESNAVTNLRNHPPKVPLSALTKGLVILFNKGGWAHSYGGPKWGQVTETLHNMVTGKTTPEMFADTAFTLAHNTGPIFNKGMLYTGYGHFIYKLLDVQRSGQVPQLYDSVESGFISPEVKSFVEAARVVFPEELTGYVDWFKVEALGAIHKYEKEKTAQMLNHGPSAFVSKEHAKNAHKYYVGVGDQDYAEAYQREEAA